MLLKHLIPVQAPINTMVRRWDNDANCIYWYIFNNGMEEPHIHNPATVVGGSIFPHVTTAGSYYVFDVVNNVGSFRFDIGDNAL